jgi:hypothetical protein
MVIVIDEIPKNGTYKKIIRSPQKERVPRREKSAYNIPDTIKQKDDCKCTKTKQSEGGRR